MRCQRIFNQTHDISASSAALRAPRNPKASQPGQLTQTFRNLNPQVGDDAPMIPPNPSASRQGGGDVPPEQHDIQGLRPLNPSQRRNAGFGLGGTFAHAIPRHELSPPPELKPPEAITFSVEKVIKKIRRSRTASAGGLSGSNYKNLKTWFHDHDAISEDRLLS